MTAPTGKPRGRPKGCVKTGGRVAGKSLDKGQRQLVSAELAGSILTTFERLGGTAAMVEWAADNQTVFYTQILSRLFPAPQKDDPDIQINQQFNANLSDTEAARRIAFVLASACHDDPTVAVRDITAELMTPHPACDWQPPVMPPLVYPGPEPEPVDPDKQIWLEELSLTDEQRRDAALVRETKEVSLENYRGGLGEQSGPGPDRQPSSRKPTVNEIRRRQLL